MPRSDPQPAARSHGDLLSEFLRKVPKVELHLHLVGSASPETVLEMVARSESGSGLPGSLEELRQYYNFRDFAHFDEVYGRIESVVRTANDVETLIVGLGRDLARQGVRYAEVTVTPAVHLSAGILERDLCKALSGGRREALEQYGVQLAWCFDFPAEEGLQAADATLEFAMKYHPPGLVSLGFTGRDEPDHMAGFATTFRRARETGLHCVPHAGWSDGPASIWVAIRELCAERVGHGIRCLDDTALLEHLRDHRIALEVCPTSEVAIGVVASLRQHPLPQLVSENLLVTLNSDDPGKKL